jgi:sugar O-acyltransferase (sialic acid O-acetyltransferase NeuD family)
MTEVIVIGAGGHAAEIDEYIAYNRKHSSGEDLQIVGFLDDNPDNYARYKFSAPLIGGARNHKVIKDHYYLMGIAGIQYRRLFVERYLAEGARFASLVHCTAYVSGSATIGEGSIVGPNSNIGPNVCIGRFTLINSRCSMGHDTRVGDYNFISPNSCFSGFTEVGDENLFGINCATIPGIKVGNRNKITAGMILDTNVGDDSVIFYRFKERVIAIPKKEREE